MMTPLAQRQQSPKLAGVHPHLIDGIVRILAAMEAFGFPMMVTDGLRSQSEQAADYAKGRTAPGDIVTNADGLLKKSDHQVRADGYGHAVDCCFLDANGQPSWAPVYPWAAYGALAEAMGLTWGGDASFKAKGLVDRPHVELP